MTFRRRCQQLASLPDVLTSSVTTVPLSQSLQPKGFEGNFYGISV
jgi:hypothetical protein